MSILQELQSEIVRIREQVGASVVGVGNHRGVGSGVVIGPDTVLTNAHNVWSERISVTFADGRTESGTVTAADVDGDIAVVNVPTGDAPPIGWNGASADTGTPVVALSIPGGRGLRTTFGFVSGTDRSFRGPRGRRIAGSLEHTAPLLPGSSGGPVVDANGALLGINTNRLGEGFYLAIPADGSLRARADKLARGEQPSAPRLGIAIAPSQVARGLRRAVGLPEVDGLLVRGVEDDSPAARAGLREGDLITAAGDSAISEPDALHDALATSEGSITLKVLRGTDEITVDVTF